MRAAWHVLGIAATSDRAAIRRAYAARLKEIPPDAEPDLFLRLRAAYDGALAGFPSDVGALPPSSPPAALAHPSGPAALVAAAIRSRDVPVAADLLARARDRGDLSLAEAMDLADRLLALLADDRELPGSEVFAAASRLGWHADSVVGDGLDLVALRRLWRRLAAERWLCSIRRQAASPWFWVGGQRAAAARLLLGSGAFVLSRLLPPEPPLRAMLAEYQSHRAWLWADFDADRIAWVERMVSRGFSRHLGRLCLLVALLPCLGIAPSFFLGVLVVSLFGRFALHLRPIFLAGLAYWVFVAVAFFVDVLVRR